MDMNACGLGDHGKKACEQLSQRVELLHRLNGEMTELVLHDQKSTIPGKTKEGISRERTIPPARKLSILLLEHGTI